MCQRGLPRSAVRHVHLFMQLLCACAHVACRKCMCASVGRSTCVGVCINTYTYIQSKYTRPALHNGTSFTTPRDAPRAACICMACLPTPSSAASTAVASTLNLLHPPVHDETSRLAELGITVETRHAAWNNGCSKRRPAKGLSHRRCCRPLKYLDRASSSSLRRGFRARA